MAASDTYIEKDASINDEIDLMRLSATSSLMARRDVIIVSSVSCIYGLGSPEEYKGQILSLRRGQQIGRDTVIRHLVQILYERSDTDFARSTFRVRGDVVDISPSYARNTIRVEFFGNEVDSIRMLDRMSNRTLEEMDNVAIYPAKHFLTTAVKLKAALTRIENELQERVNTLKKSGHDIEAHRIEQRTRFDMEMLQEIGYCKGIENYSRHLSNRHVGDRPAVLLDYFPEDFLLFVDESHVTLPQVKGMYRGDRARKENLVDFGFRLPSALDNRPLYFEEFEALTPKAVYVSATPGQYEQENSRATVELIIRPTGLVDPPVEIKAATGQIDDLLEQIRKTNELGYRTLVTTLTKKMSEDLADFLAENGLRVRYLHSEIETIERVELLHELRSGEYDVLVGINLLREGLDLPEVGLVAILDADKIGFLRSTPALIQTAGRAARNVDGRVIMYADRLSDAMNVALNEMERRRKKQLKYNKDHGITPKSVKKDLGRILERKYSKKRPREDLKKLAAQYDLKVMDQKDDYIRLLEEKMHSFASNLEFEEAARIRDEIRKLNKEKQ